jgi:putative two-component system response regulator
MVLRMEQQPNKIQPMLLSALAQLSACLIVWNFHIPNPNIVLFVVLSAVLVKYGYASGIVSGLIAFLYSAFFFSTDHSFFLYTSLNFQKFIVIGLGIAANILLIGRLQWQFERSSMEKMQAEAEEKLQETTESYRAKLYHDVLTGTYNRRYYEDIASRIVGPAGIALIDVDDFKICNDTYGHYAGDMALETAANAIRSCIRESDLLIRYGGDEFLLVLPGIPGDILQTKLEQIRTAAQMASVPGYSHFRLSLSIGGTMQAITDPMENAVRRADRLMYQAKCRKNAVTVEVPGCSLAAPEKLLQEKSQILLVDDSKLNRMILAEILGDGYHILEAENGQECLGKLRAETGNIALVLLDINMPVMDGFEVLKAMNANHTIEDIPVIMISSEDSDAAIRRSYELGASDYVNRPFDARIVYRRVTNTIKLYAKQRRLVQMVSDQIRARENNTDMLVGVLSHIVEFRNGESGLHVRHIRMITELLLHRLLEISSRYSITAEQQDMIPLASALHDIGKIGIEEKILNKPGKLTPEEFEVMKTHSMLGAQILYDLDNFSEQPLLQTAYEIARWHHERWDGRGYPDGLKGDEIPISAQLVSLADVYDALTSERCYKKAFSHEKAMQMILNGECGAFNPLLLQCLTNIQSDLKEELKQHN